MSKRSTNFTGKKPMKTKHILSLMEWVGMSDDEIRAAVVKPAKQPTAPTADAARGEAK